MYVDMSGAASGGGGTGPVIPGYGARVQSYLSVIPGDILHVIVGGRGSSCPSTLATSSNYFPGGYNGGGSGYGSPSYLGATGGGGASDIRIGGLSLANRVVVAGGGGGYFCTGDFCGAQKGGDGGKFGGTSSVIVACCGAGHPNAGGGNWTSGGVHGFSCGGGPFATSGRLGFGGNGGTVVSGGGGGGYYGGNHGFMKVGYFFVLNGFLLNRWRRHRWSRWWRRIELFH
jgi:hypothetical protein